MVDFSTKQTIPHIHYVVLSRVTTIEGLHIRNLNENTIAVSQKVEEEMSRLRTKACLQSCLTSLQEINSDGFIKAIFLNARSLHKHFVDVASDFDLPAADIAFYAETIFSIFDRNEEFSIDNFTMFRNDAPTSTPEQRPHHGTAVFTHNNCTHAQQYPQTFNIYGVEITLVKLVQFPFLVVVSLYRSQRVPLGQLYEALTHFHDNLCSDDFHIILSNFNVNWLDEQHRAGLFSLMVSRYGYHQHISTYTTNNMTCIDHIYSNICEPHIKTGVLETYYSDHKVIWIAISKIILHV